MTREPTKLSIKPILKCLTVTLCILFVPSCSDLKETQKSNRKSDDAISSKVEKEGLLAKELQRLEHFRKKNVNVHSKVIYTRNHSYLSNMELFQFEENGDIQCVIIHEMQFPLEVELIYYLIEGRLLTFFPLSGVLLETASQEILTSIYDKISEEKLNESILSYQFQKIDESRELIVNLDPNFLGASSNYITGLVIEILYDNEGKPHKTNLTLNKADSHSFIYNYLSTDKRAIQGICPKLPDVPISDGKYNDAFSKEHHLYVISSN